MSKNYRRDWGEASQKTKKRRFISYFNTREENGWNMRKHMRVLRKERTQDFFAAPAYK